MAKHIGVGLMKLSTDTAVFLMNDPGKLLIIGGSLFIKERFFKVLFPTGTSPTMIMAQPPAAIFRIFSKYSSSDRPNVW